MPGAAVPGDRRHPDQAGDLASAKGAEFGQLGEQGGDEHGPDAGHGLQQRGDRREVAIARDRLPDQSGDVPPFGLQVRERRSARWRRAGVARWPSCWLRAVISAVSWRR